MGKGPVPAALTVPTNLPPIVEAPPVLTGAPQAAQSHMMTQASLAQQDANTARQRVFNQMLAAEQARAHKPQP